MPWTRAMDEKFEMLLAMMKEMKAGQEEMKAGQEEMKAGLEKKMEAGQELEFDLQASCEPFRYLAERFNPCHGNLCDNPLPLLTTRFPKPFRQAFLAIWDNVAFPQC
ncbi:hypothetical protein AVEN_205985-1 [Araneus ventricosus]|uniref:Uncharacterized protein n=1 Tax=Araneus ventricosus TaxID=182803 RepID=A0A4Y2KUU5_ARAVE|nr:hypothetical protein AVEN_205985-1 [Araneus ventricosus]